MYFCKEMYGKHALMHDVLSFRAKTHTIHEVNTISEL